MDDDIELLNKLKAALGEKAFHLLVITAIQSVALTAQAVGQTLSVAAVRLSNDIARSKE